MPDAVFTILILIAAGMVAGTLAGLLGIGGGIIMVPVLYKAFGLWGADPAHQMHLAVATSLAIILPTGAMSARGHWKRDAVDLAIVRRWAPAVMAGALAGVYVATLMSGATLRGVFGVVAFLMGVKMLLPLDRARLGAALPAAPAFLAVPGVIGFVSALMGIGGATLSVPVMTLFGLPVRRAVGTAALFGVMIAIPAVAGFLVMDAPGVTPQGTVGAVNLLAFAIVAPASMAFARLGVRLAHALPPRAISIIFGLFLIWTGIRFLLIQ